MACKNGTFVHNGVSEGEEEEEERVELYSYVTLQQNRASSSLLSSATAITSHIYKLVEGSSPSPSPSPPSSSQ